MLIPVTIRWDLVCIVGWLVHADGRFACQLLLVVAYRAALYQAGNLEKERRTLPRKLLQ